VTSPAAFRLRDEMNGIAEVPGKVWFFELAAAVIDADRCVQCGACVAACPTDSIGVGPDDLPRLVKMCTGCSLCWDFCPRGGLRYESTWLPAGEAGGAGGAAAGELARFMVARGPQTAPVPPPAPAPAPQPQPAPTTRAGDDWRIVGGDPAPGLGQVLERQAARVREGSGFRSARAQDGGVVSAILAAALRAGDIDGALVAREDPAQRWKGVPHLATTVGEILDAGGSFYNQTMALAHLDLAELGARPGARIAAVGTPCEVQALRAMAARPWRRGRSRPEAVVLSIALLCTKSFDYKGLMLRELRDRRGVDLADVGKVDVIRGRMIVEDLAGGVIVDEPVKDFHGAALKGCDECADFLGRGADISVGSVGSAAGWSSVLVRTPAGRRAFEAVAGELETQPLDHPEALTKLDALDKRVAADALKRPLDPEGPLFVDFEEHQLWYGGTDRAPVWKEA
jgi:coenzyme F420 hydrogenase subunit beta